MKRLLSVLLSVGALSTVGYSLLPGRTPSVRPDPEGLALARLYCTRCHLLPHPEDLPRETWPFVMEWMANYLGHPKTDGPFAAIVDPREIPPHTVLSTDQVRLIRDYYVSQAPVHPATVQPPETTDGFDVLIPPAPVPRESIVTLLRMDEGNRRIYLGTARRAALHIFQPDGTQLLAAPMPSAPVSVEPDGSAFRLTLMGGFDKDRAEGQIIEVAPEGSRLRTRPLLQGYHRLVESRTVDLDGDGRRDLLAVGFGDYSDGRVSILWNDRGSATEQILVHRSGALTAGIHDFDADGRLDILLLVAQGQQQLLLFRNIGDRAFERRSLHQRRPGFGYNHLTLADVNGDGRMDVVTTNGNNMELPEPPVRPYHGVRILVNEGSLRFSEQAFLPLPGALRTVARDFDGDGDVDLASIAFYPDWRRDAPVTFLYLENIGDGRFRDQTPRRLPWGRWLAIDAADFDGDGRTDILLGAGAMTAGIPDRLRSRWERPVTNAPCVAVLLNRLNASR